MTVRIAQLAFDQVRYDADRDVLYLSVGEPREASDSLLTPEGHVIRFDENGDLIGITFVSARWLSDRDGGLSVSPPVDAEQLARAFG